MLLKQLYTTGSLKNTDSGAKFALKNRLSDAELVSLRSVSIDGKPLALENVRLEVEDRRVLVSTDLDAAHPLPFPVHATVTVWTGAPALGQGKHQLEIAFETRPFGNLHFTVEDAVSQESGNGHRVPRDEGDDYSDEIILRRRAYIENASGAQLKHVAHYSFDPHVLQGNCENFVGVAQVPIGFAGPLRVLGEHADGEFLVPMATTEGTLIASYNRGMKILNLCGGVKVTVMADGMQRAPAFVFRDARAAREFVKWVEDNIAQLRAEAEATSSVAKLQYIDPFTASRFAYLRFNFSTGDAAGQNMVGRATLAACKWILEHRDDIEEFFLESNFATDKKDSYINRMRTRGKRVTAEATVPAEIMKQYLRVDPRKLIRHHGVGNVGAFLSGANNNGLQSANLIAAMFIATGQDVADLAESSPAIIHVELTPSGDLYTSLTIPSLVVGTHGGGTSLATQRECLEILGCYGPGKVNKLAEIIGGAALAGEMSLAAAISSSDWVSSHEKFGRNR
jgi:hydroxymethylglutaryl-CoA reductase (NADPH)